MFRPNLSCVIQKTSGKSDVYGMPLPGEDHKERCSIIKLNVKNARSAVRGELSASHGSARELESDAVLLLTKTTIAAIDDVIVVAGSTFRIASLFPRHNLQGKLDHYQISCTYWSAV
jgi:hypothetical protein